MIKFWSYQREYKKYKRKIIKSIDHTILKGNTFFGSQLDLFEKNFIKKYKSKYGVAVGSGTDALLISLKSLDLKSGDEVITAANTAIPTISAIVNAGGKPKLVDIGEDYLIDIKKLKKAITKKTKVIIPVHLYGQMCDMNEIEKIAKKNKIIIIEDCAQSQGAKYKNKFAGTIGTLGCFSFYPTKILGAYGDGGFILTNDFNIYKRIKRIRFYGIETVEKNKFKNKYYANENGLNSRLDEIQASILIFKLKNFKKNFMKRQNIARNYLDNIKNDKVKLPLIRKNTTHGFHLFVVQVNKRDRFINYLKKVKIGSFVHYKKPLHKHKGFKKILKFVNLKNTENLYRKIVSIPINDNLELKDSLKIANKINQFN